MTSIIEKNAASLQQRLLQLNMSFSGVYVVCVFVRRNLSTLLDADSQLNPFLCQFVIASTVDV